MPPSREAELEAEIRRLRAVAHRREADLEDAEESTRVYRRLAYRVVAKCNDCPLCNPPENTTAPAAE